LVWYGIKINKNDTPKNKKFFLFSKTENAINDEKK